MLPQLLSAIFPYTTLFRSPPFQKRNGLHGADRFCYSIKSSSSRKSRLSSMSSNRFGGNLISYCSFASARTSRRLSFMRFLSQELCSFDNLHGRFSKRFIVICSACFSGGKEAQDLQTCAA